jgi:hypothetical protein
LCKIESNPTHKYFCYNYKDYIEDIYQTYLWAHQEKKLSAAAAELQDMTPRPMNTMLEKQSKQEAIHREGK